MKVLYVATTHERSGWGEAARDYLLAMDSVGIEVVARPLILDGGAVIPPRIKALEARSSSDCDICIQHVLPHLMDFNGWFKKNIGIYYTETSNFRSSSWPRRLNCMDELWVPNRQMIDAARESGVDVKMNVVHLPTDTSFYQELYEPHDLLKPYIQREEFLFYTIGELVVRKNLQAVIAAFHLTFGVNEPVQLVIKSSMPGLSKEETAGRIEQACKEVKAGLKIRGNQHKQEILITDRLSQTGIGRLHAGCDCFVSASFGESWCKPAFDAMAFGNTPIVPRSTGFLEYLSEETAFLVPTRPTPVHGATDTFMDIYTGNEDWWDVDLRDLGRCMRMAFEEKDMKEQMATAGIDRAHDFSHTEVGLRIADLLNQP